MRIKFKAKRGLARRSAPWMAMGTLAAYSALGGQAVAQTAPAAAGGSTKAGSQDLVVRNFSIAPGTLEEVLQAFQESAGWNVSASEDLLGIHSPGLQGMYPVAQGLRQLLEGTGLSYRKTGAHMAVLEISQASFSADVNDRMPLASPRYTEGLRDLPQTITVIPKGVIEQQGATSLADVMRNVPGLTMAAGEGGTPAGDNLTLRGNSARNDIFVDGVRDLSPQSRDPFNLEQVEVTKGPTSAISGRGSAGGTINLVSKAPSLSKSLGGSITLGNADMRRATFDLNTPLRGAHLGERTGLRMNLLWHDSGVAGRDVVKNSRWGLAPSLMFGMGTPTRLTLSYYKLKQDNISDYGIPWVPATNNVLVDYRDRPAPVPRNNFYGFADRDREVLNQDTATVKFEHDFSDNLQLRNQLRYGRSGRNSIATPPRFASTDSTVINREMRSWVAQDRIWDNQTDLRSEFQTFGIRHSMVTGGAFTNENNIRRIRSASNATTTLLNPNPYDTYTGTITDGPYVGDITGRTASLWAFDTAKLGNHFEATGGLRWERFNVHGVNTTPAPVDQNVKMTSLRGGLIYKPTRSGSIYASYGTSVSPSLEGLSYSTSNTAIPPEKTYTVETGAKWEMPGSRLLLSGALFRVAKDNARTPGLLPTDPPQVLDGQQVSRGVELSASGAVTRSVRVLGAYTFIDARIRSSNTPAEVGKFFQNTPRHSASVWITYTAKRFTAGVGPRFMGQRFGNNTNTRKVDGYATLDVMGSYRVNEHLDLRLNLVNANDAYYFDRLGGGHVVPAAARTGQVTANFRF